MYIEKHCFLFFIEEFFQFGIIKKSISNDQLDEKYCQKMKKHKCSKMFEKKLCFIYYSK